MNTLSHYLRVYRQIAKNGVAQSVAYRMEFVLRIFLGLLWASVSIGILEIMFIHTTNINGWTKPELYLVLLSYNFTVQWSDAFARRVQYLEEYIRLGKMDTYFTKPIDTQFMMVFAELDIAGLVYPIGYTIPILFFLKPSIGIIPWERLPIFVFLIFLGNILWICLKTIVMTVNFWRQRMDNLGILAWILTETGKYPISVLPKPIRYVFYSIFPIAFFAIVPTEFLLNRSSFSAVLGACIVTVSMVTIARLIWQHAIKNYSSASN